MSGFNPRARAQAQKALQSLTPDHPAYRPLQAIASGTAAPPSRASASGGMRNMMQQRQKQDAPKGLTPKEREAKTAAHKAHRLASTTAQAAPAQQLALPAATPEAITDVTLLRRQLQRQEEALAKLKSENAAIRSEHAANVAELGEMRDLVNQVTAPSDPPVAG